MSKNKKLTRAFIIYWLLLLYIVAALIWWFVSLEKQSKERFVFEIGNLKNIAGVENNTSSDTESYQKLKTQLQRRTTKHISEGLTFLLIISIGAYYIYRVVNKQFALNKQQQNFIMAVTHELKTPIAISKLNMETLLKRNLDENQQKLLLQNTVAEMHRLNDLASNILIVSQIETGDYRMNKEQIEIVTLLNNLINEIAGQYPKRQILSSLNGQSLVFGDALLLKLTFSNLLDNALKYSNSEDKVKIELVNKDGNIVIKVLDEGFGINDKDSDKIFEKFYRTGNEMTRRKKGTGLGLYLCKKILNDHKATIEFSKNSPKGSIFTVRIQEI